MKTIISLDKLANLFYCFADAGVIRWGKRYPLGYGYGLVLRQTNAGYSCTIEGSDWFEDLATSFVWGTGEFADDLTYAIELCYNQFINA